MTTRIPGFLLVLLLLLTACASVPVQEMSDARQAVRAAREAGAAQKAPEQYHAALSWLGMARKALATGDYAGARNSAEKARALAVEALTRSRAAN